MIPLLTAIWMMTASVSGTTQGPVPRIAARDVEEFVGKNVEICGHVVMYACSNARDTVLLNLDAPFWTRGVDVSIGVRTSQRPAFGERFEDQYLGAYVCATGRVEQLDRRYVVVADTPASLVITNRKQPAPEPFAPEAVQNCAAEVTLPILTREVPPAYTPEAMRAIIQGRMVVDAVVLPDGTVGDVRVVYSLDREKGLDQQGVAAVKQWRFRPGRLRGEVVPMIVTITLSFRLK